MRTFLKNVLLVLFSPIIILGMIAWVSYHALWIGWNIAEEEW